ncbi:putative membrane protein [Solimicrobium silvestre]|uniref:Putative membrane protein n=2 Tax=Solimicrobium silvestre TaxID=2099400 RepID=A0A2S9GVQ9_9BURK|nr:putative membrane protein [Solimicrobium silvestre]
METVNLWPLIGVAVVIAGFVLRTNPVLVVIISAIATGLAAHLPLDKILALLGSGFIKTRNLPLIFFLPLAAIGLSERFGLKEHAQSSIAKIRSATAGRLLIVYLFIREISAAMGLTSLGGHPQMVRPLIAPMAEAATQNQYGVVPEKLRHKIRAMSAATDNVGLFFGEDVFVAFGAIILMQTILRNEGIEVNAIHMALWGIPTAVSAFVIHSWNLHRLDKQIARELGRGA